MSEDPRVEAVEAILIEASGLRRGDYLDGELASLRELSAKLLAAADAAAWRPISEAGEHEQIIAYRCSWGSVVVSEGYPLKDGEWVIPGSAASVEPIACQPLPTPPQEQE